MQENFASSQPIVLTLSANDLNYNFCPVKALKTFTSQLKTFTSQFKHSFGPLFTFKSGRPVSSSQLCDSPIKTCYIIHSMQGGFRIGAATEAAKSGLFENVIQELGC